MKLSRKRKNRFLKLLVGGGGENAFKPRLGKHGFRAISVTAEDFAAALSKLPSATRSNISVRVLGRKGSLGPANQSVEGARILNSIESSGLEYLIVPAQVSGRPVFLGLPTDDNPHAVVFGLGASGVPGFGDVQRYRQRFLAAAGPHRAADANDLVTFTQDFGTKLVFTGSAPIFECNGLYGPKLPSIPRPKPAEPRPSENDRKSGK